MATITSSSQAWAWLEFSTTYSHQARLARLGVLFTTQCTSKTPFFERRCAAASTHSSNWPSLCLGSFDNYVDIILKFCPFLTSYLPPREHFLHGTSTVIGIFWAPTYPPHLVHVVLERPTWHTDGLAIIFLFKNNLVMMWVTIYVWFQNLFLKSRFIYLLAMLVSKSLKYIL